MKTTSTKSPSRRIPLSHTMNIRKFLKNVKLLSSKMVSCTLASGLAITGMDRECNYGLMVLNMRVLGSMARLTERASLPTSMEMSMMDSGRTIKRVALVSTSTTTEQNMRANGSTTTSTARALKPGWMVANMKENTVRGKNMERENTSGRMAAFMMAVGKITKSQALVSTFGQMDANT